MITNKNSWIFLVFALVVLAVAAGASLNAMAYGEKAGKFFGAANLIMAIAEVIFIYNKIKDK